MIVSSGGDAGLLAIGSRLAEFEVTRVVGQGGFGVVYEAWDPTLERVVAIKEYLPSTLSTRQADGTVMPLSERHRETFDLGMRSFINEARLLAQFDHPSLLKVYRFWQERGTTYMVMPFYRGDTLRQAIAKASGEGGVDEGWLLRIMDGITQALAVMHAVHCYHRDIAPDNIILLEGSGRPVVLDFGAARRVISDKTQAITVILKPGYAPIEQYAEMPDMAQGAWTDVYALAAVMHVMITGRAPPPSVARLLSDSYVPLSGNEAMHGRFSAALLGAVDAGLGVRPEARPQSMAALREALGLEGERTIIRPVTQAAPMRPPAQTSMPSSTRAPATAFANDEEATRVVGPGMATQGAATMLEMPLPETRSVPQARRPSQPAQPLHSSHGTLSSDSATADAKAAGKSRAPMLVGIGALIIAVAAGGAWWAMKGTKSGDSAAASVPSTTSASTAQASGTSSGASSNTSSNASTSASPSTTSNAPSSTPPAAASTPPPPAPQAVARTPLESLQSLAEGASPTFGVTATPGKPEVVVGKDRLAFEVRSKREGFVYVYLLSSGGEMFMLFPNLLDKYNKVNANGVMNLPRASWPMNAGGPPGVNQFVVLVSERERDFGATGVSNDGVFPQFQLPVLAALEAARGNGPPPLLGKPVCASAAPCGSDLYGVGTFRITER